MRNKTNWLYALLLVAIGFNIGIGLGALAQTQAAPQYLPIVAREPAQVTTQITTLIGGDNSFISAARSPAGCVFFGYIARGSGNVIHVVRINANGTISEVDLPPLVNATRATPQFVPPGEKHADVSLIFTDALELFYTSRQPGDEDGQFNVMRLRMAIPPCA